MMIPSWARGPWRGPSASRFTSPAPPPSDVLLGGSAHDEPEVRDAPHLVDGLVPLEPMVLPHEADIIFDQWLGDEDEIVVRAANGATLPRSRDEVQTIEVIRNWIAGPDGVSLA